MTKLDGYSQSLEEQLAIVKSLSADELLDAAKAIIGTVNPPRSWVRLRIDRIVRF